MSFIVWDINDKDMTIDFFKYDVDALKYKNELESYGNQVKYVDIPNVSINDARTLYLEVS